MMITVAYDSLDLVSVQCKTVHSTHCCFTATASFDSTSSAVTNSTSSRFHNDALCYRSRHIDPSYCTELKCSVVWYSDKSSTQ